MIPGFIRYDRTSILLHWIVAAGVLTMLALGTAIALMSTSPTKVATIQVHKSIGIIVAMFVLLRLAWRGWRGFAGDIPSRYRWQPHLAHAVHVLLLFTTIMLPITGILKSVTFARRIDVFGVPFIPVLIHERNDAWHAVASLAHDGLAWLLAGFLLLHVADALTHLVDRRGGSPVGAE